MTCPECDAEFKLKAPLQPGKKVRCPECEHAFLPDNDDEEEDEAPKKKKRAVDDEDDAPEPKKKGKGKARKDKKKSSALPLILIGGGVLALIGLLVCGGVLYFVFGRTSGPGPIANREDGKRGDDAKGGDLKIDGGGGGIFGKSPTINKDTFLKLEAGLTMADVDAIMGAPGTAASRQEATKFVLQYDIFDDGKPVDPLFYEPSAKYVVYVNGPQQLLAGFAASKKHGHLLVDYTWWDSAAKKATGAHGPPERLDDNRDHVLKTRADREATPKLFADPKWTKGPAIRSSLIGVWSGATDAYEFKKDGKLTYYSKGLKGAKGTYYDGSYKFIDDAQVELSHIYLTWPPGPPTRVYKVYVTASELNLAEKTRFDDFIRGRSYQRQKK